MPPLAGDEGDSHGALKGETALGEIPQVSSFLLDVAQKVGPQRWAVAGLDGEEDGGEVHQVWCRLAVLYLAGEGVRGGCGCVGGGEPREGTSHFLVALQ